MIRPGLRPNTFKDKGGASGASLRSAPRGRLMEGSFEANFSYGYEKLVKSNGRQRQRSRKRRQREATDGKQREATTTEPKATPEGSHRAGHNGTQREENHDDNGDGAESDDTGTNS